MLMAYPYLQDLMKGLFGLDIWLPIPTFGTMFALAGLVVYRIFRSEVRRMEAIGVLPVSGKPLSRVDIEVWFTSMAGGYVGARLFSVMEQPHEFLQDPLGMLFIHGGFAILGGFIVGGLSAFCLLKWWKIPFLPTLDASAPAIILGFAIGRIGCQLSGDGDWGIAADMTMKPAWLPTWLWAQTYTGNLTGQVIAPPGVYPTSIYEAALAFMTFLLLWSVRKNKFVAGWTFSLLLVVGGVQRFLIEQIRVNTRYSWLGLKFTQAEFITSVCIVVGIVGLITSYKLSHHRSRRPMR